MKTKSALILIFPLLFILNSLSAQETSPFQKKKDLTLHFSQISTSFGEFSVQTKNLSRIFNPTVFYLKEEN